jgi:hypothetical protein
MTAVIHMMNDLYLLCLRQELGNIDELYSLIFCDRQGGNHA